MSGRVQTISFFILFFIIIFLRLHTFFIEYYGRDELVSVAYSFFNTQYQADYHQKGVIFTWLINLSYYLFGYTTIGMHIIGIIAIFLTSILVYKTAQLIYNNSKISFVAAFTYGFFLNYGNQEIVEINGEFFLNFVFAVGFYYLALITIYKRYIYFILFLFCCFIAYNIKFQGIFLILPVLFYYGILYPYYKYSKLYKKYYFIAISVITLLLVLVLVFIYFSPSAFLHEFIQDKVNYIIIKFQRDLGWWLIFVKPIHRYGMLMLYATPLWMGALISIIKTLKKKSKTDQDMLLLSFFIPLFFTPFSTGINLFFHYFILLYIPLALSAAPLIYKWYINPYSRKLLFYSTLPFLFLGYLWFMKDIYIVKQNQDGFYQYYKEWNIIQSILIGGNNDYLLPDPYIKRTLEMTKNIPKTDPVIIFGQAGELVYFSKLLNITTFWLELQIFAAYNPLLNSQGFNKKYLDNNMMYVLTNSNYSLVKKTPRWFIDISQNPTNGLDKLGDNLVQDLQSTYAYLNKHYKIVSKDEKYKITIWKLSH